MTYRLNAGQIHTFVGNPDVAIPRKQAVVIAIDPGKTNMAIVVGNTMGKVLAVAELSGKDCDTTEYCRDFRQFLDIYLKNVKILMVGVEQAVQYKGMQYYTSQMVLTEIRANILNYFLDRYGIGVIEINNYAWKHAILPEGYRGHGEKGSLRYFAERGITGYTHDVTDCMCMYMYLYPKAPKPERFYTDDIEEPLYKYTLTFTDYGEKEHFDCNPEYTFLQNISYYVNRSDTDTFVVQGKSAYLSLEDIYSYESKVHIIDDNFEVVVTRVS